MTRNIALLVLATVTATGCMAVVGKRTTPLDKSRIIREIEGRPTVALVVHDLTGKPDRLRRALDRMRKKFSFLPPEGEEIENPDYTIDLTADMERSEHLSALAGATLTLVPAIHSREMSVAATLRNARGEVLGGYQASRKSSTVIQMHLLYLLPVTGPLYPMVHHKTWNVPLRDVFIQVGEALAEEQRAVPTQERSTPVAGGES